MNNIYVTVKIYCLESFNNLPVLTQYPFRVNNARNVKHQSHTSFASTYLAINVSSKAVKLNSRRRQLHIDSIEKGCAHGIPQDVHRLDLPLFYVYPPFPLGCFYHLCQVRLKSFRWRCTINLNDPCMCHKTVIFFYFGLLCLLAHVSLRGGYKNATYKVLMFSFPLTMPTQHQHTCPMVVLVVVDTVQIESILDCGMHVSWIYTPARLKGTQTIDCVSPPSAVSVQMTNKLT